MIADPSAGPLHPDRAAHRHHGVCSKPLFTGTRGPCDVSYLLSGIRATPVVPDTGRADWRAGPRRGDALGEVAVGGGAAAAGQQPQSSPRQDRKPCQIATAATPSPITGSSHQPPNQFAVMTSPNSTAAACTAHR